MSNDFYWKIYKYIIKYNNDIKKLIYTIRGKQVMLDSDVAMLYYCETRKINQAVKRNIQRFPESFVLNYRKKKLIICSHNLWLHHFFERLTSVEYKLLEHD